MPTYTVHAPPPKTGEATIAPERFVFVRDGFHFWAFMLPPLWLLVHRLWLAFVIFVVCSALIGVALSFAGASTSVQLSASVLISLLMGLEVPSIERWTLARRGWKTLGFIIGDDQENAERRFFTEWKSRAALSEPPRAAAEPHYTTPVLHGTSPGNDVIGLFPEPELKR